MYPWRKYTSFDGEHSKSFSFSSFFYIQLKCSWSHSLAYVFKFHITPHEYFFPGQQTIRQLFPINLYHVFFDVDRLLILRSIISFLCLFSFTAWLNQRTLLSDAVEFHVYLLVESLSLSRAHYHHSTKVGYIIAFSLAVFIWSGNLFYKSRVTEV